MNRLLRHAIIVIIIGLSSVAGAALIIQALQWMLALMPSLAKPEVAELIYKQVTGVNQRAEKPHFRIKRFAILYKLLDMDDGELTKTGKIRRKFVREKYQNLYDGLYDEAVKEKQVEALFQYQDGQTTKVQTKISFFTVEGI